MYEVSFGYVEREEVGAECLRKSGRDRQRERVLRGLCVKRDLHVSKETCMCQKRPACVKRDLHVSKEIVVSVKEPERYMRRRIHACRMNRRIHVCHMRRRLHVCHMRRRTHACQRA
jgi:hypothetical protein